MVEQMHLLTQMMWMKWIVQVLAKLLSQDVFLNHFHSKVNPKIILPNTWSIPNKELKHLLKYQESVAMERPC